MDVAWAPVGLAGAVGLLSGPIVPRLIAALPEPTPDPHEDPDDFPDKVLYADLAVRPRLAPGCAIAGAAAGAVLGAALGWNWALAWLLVLVPIGCALAVVDYVTWYLPTVLVWAGAAAVLLGELVATLALQDWRVLAAAAIGFLGLGGYYGLLWLVSPRIMAFGDVRLGALLGLALGPFGFTTVLLSVFFGALVGALALPALRLLGNSIRRHIPFGPFLLVGAVAAVALGQVVAAL